MEPTGVIRAVRVEMRRPPHRIAVYATVICVDEAGKEWSFDVASFNFDLKPFPPDTVGGGATTILTEPDA